MYKQNKDSIYILNPFWGRNYSAHSSFRSGCLAEAEEIAGANSNLLSSFALHLSCKLIIASNINLVVINHRGRREAVTLEPAISAALSDCSCVIFQHFDEYPRQEILWGLQRD